MNKYFPGTKWVSLFFNQKEPPAIIDLKGISPKSFLSYFNIIFPIFHQIVIFCRFAQSLLVEKNRRWLASKRFPMSKRFDHEIWLVYVHWGKIICQQPEDREHYSLVQMHLWGIGIFDVFDRLTNLVRLLVLSFGHISSSKVLSNW